MKQEVGPAESVLIVVFALGTAYVFALAGVHDVNILFSAAVTAIAEPPLVLAHELGHAVAAVRVTGRRARVQAGRPPFRSVFSIGKVSVEYSSGSGNGICRFDRSAPVSGWGLLAITLAGPAVNIALGLILAGVVLMSWSSSPTLMGPLILIASGSLLLGFGNLIPETYLPEWWPGAFESDVLLSDGYVGRRGWRRAPSAHLTSAPNTCWWGSAA